MGSPFLVVVLDHEVDAVFAEIPKVGFLTVQQYLWEGVETSDASIECRKLSQSEEIEVGGLL